MIDITTKIPLLKLLRKATKERVFKRFKDNYCVIYSEKEKKYMGIEDEWVDDPGGAYINTLANCYEATSNMLKEGIVYCLIKI